MFRISEDQEKTRNRNCLDSGEVLNQLHKSPREQSEGEAKTDGDKYHKDEQLDGVSQEYSLSHFGEHLNFKINKVNKTLSRKID